LKKLSGIASRILKILPSLLYYRIKIRVEFCSIAKKLKFEIMCQHHAHPSFGVLATLAGMK
jgi:hypothetical protein